MYSTHAPFGTAAVSDTCSSIRKCGHTGDVERLGEVRDLEPRRDAADARAVDLDDRAGAALEVLAEMRRVIERLADRDRHRRLCAASSTWPPRSSAGSGSSSHASAERRDTRARGGSASGDGERLVGVDHQLERVAHRLAHGGEPRDVLGDRRLADLDLGAAESLRLRGERLVDQLLRRSGAASRLRSCTRARAAARRRRTFHSGSPARRHLQVPQRGVDRGEREAGDRADRRRVRVEEEVLPDRLDLVGIAADQPRREMIAQQRDHRRAAGADRVRVAGALRAVGAGDAHDRRLLRDERLDRVGAHDLRRQVDLQDLDALDRAMRCASPIEHARQPQRDLRHVGDQHQAPQQRHEPRQDRHRRPLERHSRTRAARTAPCPSADAAGRSSGSAPRSSPKCTGSMPSCSTTGISTGTGSGSPPSARGSSRRTAAAG